MNEGEKGEKKNEGAEIDPKKQARIEKQKEIARKMGIPYIPVDDFSHINTKGKSTSVDATTKTDSGSKQAVQTKVVKKEESTEEESQSKPSSFYNEPGAVKLLVVHKGDKSSVYVVTDGAHPGGDLAWKKYPLSPNLKIPDGFEKAVAQFIKQDVDEALTNEGRWADRAAEKRTNEAVEAGAEKAWDGSKKAAEEGKSLLLDAVEYGKEVLDEKFPDKDVKKEPSVKEAPAKGDSEGAGKSQVLNKWGNTYEELKKMGFDANLAVASVENPTSKNVTEVKQIYTRIVLNHVVN